MKKNFILILFLILTSNITFSQILHKPTENTLLTVQEKKDLPKFPALTSTGASVGFNLGVASVEGEVGFAISAFAELKARDISFVPQANYWNVKKQTNFELAALARFYLSKRPLIPYLDAGLGINFYKSGDNNFSKLSILAGGGIELTNLGTSFNLLVDGKYKLIINDKGNLSCFIFTAGMKFPFK